MPTQDEDHVNCDWCGNSTHTDELTEFNGTAICSECYDAHVITCADCSDEVHSDDSIDVGGWRRTRQVCMDCYSCEYFYCEGCDEHMPSSEYGADSYCNDCYGDDEDYCDCGECGYGGGGGEGIRRWGDRPDLVFHDTPFIGPIYTVVPNLRGRLNYTPEAGKYYMGMEIEVEDTDAHVIGQFAKDHTDIMWATTDATLDNGYEIVTMPHTYDAWMQEFPWDEWTERIHNQVPNQDGYSSNGIHIHISRTAFANSKGRVLASHLYKFMQFIRINEGAIMMLSERSGNSYCEWNQQRDARDGLKDAKTDTSTNNYERYRPVNTQNRQTIELRFFDGRTDPTFMKRSIQFVHSVAEFTRHGSAKSDRSWEMYTAYISEHADMYPELHAYLVDKRKRLLLAALTTEANYADRVLPAIKQRKERDRREAREEVTRQARVLQERTQQMSDPVACTCDACTAYAQRQTT